MFEFIVASFVVGGILSFYASHKKEVDKVRDDLKDLLK